MRRLVSKWRSSLTMLYRPLAAAQSIGDAYHHWSRVLSHRRGKYSVDISFVRLIKKAGKFTGKDRLIEISARILGTYSRTAAKREIPTEKNMLFWETMRWPTDQESKCTQSEREREIGEAITKNRGNETN